MFIKKITAVSGLLVVTIVILSVLLLLDGPRIRKVEYDPAKLTTQASQTIVFRSNQPLKEVKENQVSVDPAVDFSIATSGESVILQLRQPLNYDAEYRFSINGLESSRGKTVDFSTSIKTSPAEYYYLKRNQGFNVEGFSSSEREDEIKNGSLKQDERVVYTAKRILDFDLVEGGLAVTREVEDSLHELIIYNEEQGSETVVELPGKGAIAGLSVSPDKKLVGFTLTSDYETGRNMTYNRSLFVYDIKYRMLFEVKGLDGKQVSTGTWKWHPDSKSIVAQTYNSGVLLVDSYAQESPLPLGNFSSIGNFSPDGTKVILSDRVLGPVVFDLRNKKPQDIKVQPIAGVQPIFINAKLLPTGENNFLKFLQRLDPTTDKYTGFFVVSEGSTDRKIHEVPVDETQIFDFNSSPNGQYVVIESSKLASQEFDAYDENPRPNNIETHIINSVDGKSLRNFDGFRLIWKQ